MDYKMDNNEDTRKADNTIINHKKELDKVDEQIDIQRNKMQELNDMQERVNEIVDNINQCIELLSKSIKGPTTENMFNDMYNTNKNFGSNVSNNIENNQLEVRKRLNELYKEKDNILEENKNNSQKEEYKRYE